jgi:hypothetical protein
MTHSITRRVVKRKEEMEDAFQGMSGPGAGGGEVKKAGRVSGKFEF